ncbi:hypothetical protein SAMN03080617_02236 [Algoriphagus alkaliphilus]|uniref:Uncharacterized protein n=1 Tax=Algoriphagus alkaliphilus TaxID=279824 RepID=A0A1G5Y4Q5_9BACT|nr:hypothetical protein [Algoriphagus alkaliphilus]MBA4298769.1 hypothetical protein [Cyclobacterium sp.]SDA77552.1 hypothetical protein SAMN03080617_02236 [Algoriphagus alkaliphilus]
MKTLPKNWITEGLIDFEYKKYQLLAYLQEANREFQAVKLYPVLSDLIDHHRVLHELNSGKTQLSNLFPKALNGIDFQSVQLQYQPKVEDGEVMKEISQITDFALPRITRQIEEGKSIYDFVEEQVEFEPVGILPIYNREGFVLMTRESSSDVHAFRYKSNMLQMAGEKFRSITFWLLGIFQKNLVNTLEKLKMQLIREVKELPNPATWRVHSPHVFPIEETLIPLSKRLLLKSVS